MRNIQHFNPQNLSQNTNSCNVVVCGVFEMSLKNAKFTYIKYM